MLRKIHLHGSLADLAQFKDAELDVDTPLTLFCALRSQVKPFRKYCEDNRLAIILVGEDDQPQSLKHDDFNMTFGNAKAVHLVPETEGAGIEWAAVATWLGSYGVTSVVVVAIAYVAVNMAIAFAIGAVLQALSPQPKMGRDSARPEENPSFIYNGPVNVVEQGYAVPLVYGIHMTGSIQISAGIQVEEIGYTPPASPGDEDYRREIPPVAWQWGA